MRDPGTAPAPVASDGRRRRGHPILAAIIVAYAVAVAAWQGLRLAVGDGWWWLGLANTLSFYLLLPGIVLWPLSWLTRRWAVIAAAELPPIVLLLLYGGLLLPPRAAAPGADGERLRVMSFNVLGRNRDAGTVEQAIRAANPDLVCFQEFNPSLAQDLVARLGSDYPYQVLAASQSTRRIGMISRYPLRDEGEIADPDPRHGGRAATLTLDGQAVLVVNAHAAQFGFQAVFASGDPGALGMAARVREDQARRWLERIRQAGGPAVLCGDLNVTDQNTAYTLLAAGLQDTFRRAGWGLGHTWPAAAGAFRGIPAPARLFRLDYVWATPHWRVVSAHVAAWDGQSDHLPVVADLELE